MTKLRDLVAIGSPSEVSVELLKNAKWLEDEATSIWNQSHLGDASRVFPGLLRTTARQLRILEASPTLPIEVAAGACRTTFEVNVRARLVAADPSNIMRFQMEYVNDEQSLIQAFLKLANDDSEEHAEILRERLAQIQSILDRRGLTSMKPALVANNARAAGIFDEYDTLYRFYSKYVHGSAWLTLAPDDRRDGSDYRNIFSVHTQIYAGDTLKRILDVVSDHSKSG